MARPTRRVLFVCTGNICRSPTAEAVLQAKLAAAGLADRVSVASCGTHDYHIGEPPDARAQRHAQRRGYDLSRLRARLLTAEDVERYDLLLALDRGHARFLRRLAGPGAAEKVRLLMSYAPSLGLADVPDPYYEGPEAFEHALDLIEQAADGLVAALAEELGREAPG